MLHCEPRLLQLRCVAASRDPAQVDHVQVTGHFLYMMQRLDFLHDDFSRAVQTHFVRWRGSGRLVMGKSITGLTEICINEKLTVICIKIGTVLVKSA